VDATLIAIERPKGDKQKGYYSGKHKHHGIKMQIIIDELTKSILSIAFCHGRVHDKTLYLRKTRNIPPGLLILSDLGYFGLHKKPGHVMPHKKPKGRELTAEQRAENKTLSSRRVLVEHVFAIIKRFKILGTKYRNRRRNVSRRLNIISCISNELLAA
jgi:hypothetical protein